MISLLSFESPVGKICLKERDGKIFEMRFEEGPCVSSQRPSKTLLMAKKQLKEYFSAQREHFELPILMQGSKFQLEVWKAVAEIGYAETKTYADVAKKIGRPRAYRAVGNALHANKMVLVIPCHRVVSTRGIGGFGAGKWRKAWLQDFEKKMKGRMKKSDS